MCDTPDVAAGTVRLVRAVGRRVSTEDPADLKHLQAIADEVDRQMLTAVNGLRRSGFTDAMIGAELGVTKQAVQKRWPRQP